MSVNVTVKLFASFRTGRFSVALQNHPEGTDCRSILLKLGLAEGEVGIVMVNGRHAPLDYVLNDGDTLALFPLLGGG